MNIKTKIALHSVMQKVSRGIITEDQAAAEFKKLTGQELEDVIDPTDEETGKHLAFLVSAYPEIKAAPQSDEPTEDEPTEDEPTEDEPTNEPTEDEPAKESSDAPAVPVDHPKRTRQNKPKEAK